MSRNILSLLFVAILVGCGNPNPTQRTQPEKLVDYKGIISIPDPDLEYGGRYEYRLNIWDPKVKLHDTTRIDLDPLDGHDTSFIGWYESSPNGWHWSMVFFCKKTTQKCGYAQRDLAEPGKKWGYREALSDPTLTDEDADRAITILEEVLKKIEQGDYQQLR